MTVTNESWIHLVISNQTWSDSFKRQTQSELQSSSTNTAVVVQLKHCFCLQSDVKFELFLRILYNSDANPSNHKLTRRRIACWRHSICSRRIIVDDARCCLQRFRELVLFGCCVIYRFFCSTFCKNTRWKCFHSAIFRLSSPHWSQNLARVSLDKVLPRNVNLKLKF